MLGQTAHDQSEQGNEAKEIYQQKHSLCSREWGGDTRFKDRGSCLKKLRKYTSGSPTLELPAEPVKAKNAGPQPQFLIQWVARKNRGCSVKCEFQVSNF